MIVKNDNGTLQMAMRASSKNIQQSSLNFSTSGFENGYGKSNLYALMKFYLNLYLCRITILVKAYEIRCGYCAEGVYLGQSTSGK